MKRYCHNCFHPLPYKAKFCAHCGQKDTDGKYTMRELLSRLGRTIFHLEGKFLRTAWQLFVPGMVTSEFFKGKQARYPHPFRLFAVAMFFFLLILNWALKDAQARKSNNLFNTSTLAVNARGDTVRLDSRSFFQRIEYRAILEDLRQDYRHLPADWRTAEAEQSMDSLLKSYQSKYLAKLGVGLSDTLPLDVDTITMGLVNREIRISALDVGRYTPDEIMQRYQITGRFDQVAVRQGIKSLRDPNTLAHSIIGSLTWTLLSLVAVMAGLLSLLYLRQKRYYVEHFIFLLHFHTGALLVMLLAIITIWQDLLPYASLGVFVVGTALAMYFAMWRFYGQGWLTTLAKWLTYCVLYTAGFVVLFILGSIVVFFIF